MRVQRVRLLTIFAGGLLLAGCTQIMSQAPQAPQTATVDDDTVCRNSGAPGSNPYVACMKERDVARESQQRRMDRTHQRMVNDMLDRR